MFRVLIFVIFFALSAIGAYFLLSNHTQVQTLLSKYSQNNQAENSLPKPRLENIYAPVLMYHHIASKTPPASYYVSPEIFESQMAWLKENHFTVISADDFYLGLSGEKDLPQKPVLITFDDGVMDQYQNALPILKKYGYPATFFIKLNNVGEGKGGMNYQMLRELVSAKMTIGSHSMNHDNMAHMDEAQLKYELTQSKSILEKNLNIKVEYFSFPGGAFSDQTISETAKAGYKMAFTTKHEVYHQIKTINDLYKISRIHIDNEMPSFENWIQNINLK